MEVWIGVIVTIIIAAIGWNQYRTSGIITSIQTTIAETTKRLDERINDESKVAEKRSKDKADELMKYIKEISGHILEDINKISKRLSGQIKDVSNNVLYKDVFEQHEKLEDARYEAVQKMNDVLKEQLKTSSSSNTQEHNRICGKVDAIPQIIKEEIDRSIRAHQ